MRNSLLRVTARKLMAFALRVCPLENRDWATAMSAEMEYVESPVRALVWAMGCTGVVLRRLCASLFRPKGKEQGGLLSEISPWREGKMRKFVKVSAAVLALASLLFLLAPTFQQGLKMSARSWLSSLSESSWNKTLQRLAETAEANHDPEALAFVAMRIPQSPQRDKFADEAVERDARLTWIYYFLSAHDRLYSPGHLSPNWNRWLARLQIWAPDNASVYALEADPYFPSGVVTYGDGPHEQDLLAKSPMWLSTMDKAFSATNYESYMSRRAVLDRDVMQRYKLEDPSRVLLGDMFSAFTTFHNLDVYQHAILLKKGDELAAKGDFKQAEDCFWRAERMAELIQLHGDPQFENRLAMEIQLQADPRLQAAYQKSGDTSVANLLAYRVASLQQAKLHLEQGRENPYLVWSQDLRLFDATFVQLSLLTMSLSLALIFSCGVYMALRRILRFSSDNRLRSVFTTAGILGGAAFFLSSVGMYFGYAPYAAALQGYMVTSNPVDASESLLRFQGLEAMPSSLLQDANDLYFLNTNFWYGVILAGSAIIFWILISNVLRKFRHGPHMPVAPAQ